MLSPARRFAGFVVIGSLVAAVANLATSATLPAVSQPVRFHEAGSLAHLTVDEHDHLAERFGLYAELRGLAAGATIVVPTTPVLDDYLLEHYALAEVALGDYPVELTEAQAAMLEDPRLVGTNEMVISGREIRPYVVVSTEAPATLRVLLFGETVVIVEESIYARVIEASHD